MCQDGIYLKHLVSFKEVFVAISTLRQKGEMEGMQGERWNWNRYTCIVIIIIMIRNMMKNMIKVMTMVKRIMEMITMTVMITMIMILLLLMMTRHHIFFKVLLVNARLLRVGCSLRPVLLTLASLVISMIILALMMIWNIMRMTIMMMMTMRMMMTG